MINRSSGILMHLSSLPGEFECGTMGAEARSFIDMIAGMGYTYWQLLPINPVNVGMSPYSNQSLFAGNPSFIEPSYLVDEGLLTASEVNDTKPGLNENGPAASVDIKRLILLRKAYTRLTGEAMNAVKAFAAENEQWVYDYALFMILKNEYGDMAWNKWPAFGLRLYKEEAISEKRTEKEKDVMFWVYVQYLFYRQFEEMKKYANARGVYIIGDLPIYASHNSSDVWAGKKLFELNNKLVSRLVAGVPPDYFNKNGQLWGNPLYSWEEMKKDGFAWWLRRIDQGLRMFDIVRIDHFRGFYNYWAVPYQNKTAKRGTWLKGPGMSLFSKINKKYDSWRIIAEDLGDIDRAAKEFFKKVGYPGMRVMQFGFESKKDAAHITRNYVENCVAYTGTHDNDTILGWYRSVSPEVRKLSLEYCKCAVPDGEEGELEMCMSWIETLWNSKAALTIVPIQDLCGLGSEARMNTPGTVNGNWSFRVTNELLERIDKNRIKELNTKTGRSGLVGKSGGAGSGGSNPGETAPGEVVPDRTAATKRAERASPVS
ncbi:MAG: 4-alpha-glucanotransferase [Oscillospiraceae bacterium]|nr:4-alpha-glucanotransferase [Oscillospiraceae bacterium]